jgi:predicted AlkP superfamily pyrophosphatase or phosphodiesterase
MNWKATNTKSGKNSKNKVNVLKCVLAVFFCLISVTAMSSPKLVLQITVDGLRADLLDRYAKNFDSGGFQYLRKQGVEFRNAHYLHANTETIVGHTTLATGATPAVHGMVGNVWYQADTGELGYNIEDSQAPLIPTRQDVKAGAQLDPAQRRARSSGRSPREILAPTFSDVLTIASNGKSKVFGVSGKDRGAVAMAGKSGTAYWYSTDTGDFQSSQYYMDAYPEWVNDWNQKRQAESLSGKNWELLLEQAQYRHRDKDDRPYEVDLKGYGRTFPHPYGAVEHPLFFSRVLVSPKGDQLLLDFSKALIRNERIGEDEDTDFLSISFSSVDAVNHFFGPSSLENEDVVVQLDRTLAELFEFIDAEIGLKNTYIVLSADHGMAEMPEYAEELGYGAGRIYGDEVLDRAKQISEQLYGAESIVKDFFRPYLYLDEKTINENELDRAIVSVAIAAELAKMQGVGGAIATRSIEQSAHSSAIRAVRHNQHPERSGDVYVFQSPYWFMFDRGAVAGMHGSPWKYDTHVPLIFVSPGVKPATVYRSVHAIDVAPTLSAMLGISAPASSQGEVLTEALGN